MNFCSVNFLRRWFRGFLSFALFASALFFATAGISAEGNLEPGFAAPPDSAKPRVYWFWLFNRVDKAGITRDLEQFKTNTDRKSTRLNSSHLVISYAVFCLKKKR